MKTIHIGLSVTDIAASTAFYSRLFGVAPTVARPDYAKWRLEEPRVNFSISRRDEAPGAFHLGIQVEAPEELSEIAGRLKDADEEILAEGRTTCCYHVSDKAWVRDPQGVRWETFRTEAESAVYGEDLPGLADPKVASGTTSSRRDSACCCA